MSITIELPPAVEAGLKAKAEEMGVTVDELVRKSLEEVADRSSESSPLPLPIRSLYGIWAKHGPAPSSEEIDEVRREAWPSSRYDTEEW